MTYISSLRTIVSARWLTLASLLLGALPAHASGVFEINQDCAAVGCFPGDSPGFPVQITMSGHFRLTSDLITDGEGFRAAAIHVESQNGSVTLDLNGFTLHGPFVCVATPVTGCTQGLNTIQGIEFVARTGILRNGTVRGFGGWGMYFGVRNGMLIEDVSFVENGGGGAVAGYMGSMGHTVRGSRFVRNGNHGYFNQFQDFAGTRFERNLFYGNQLAGLMTVRSSAADNLFRRNGGVGLHGGFEGCTMSGNLFLENNAGGTQFQFCAIQIHNMCDNTSC